MNKYKLAGCLVLAMAAVGFNPAGIGAAQAAGTLIWGMPAETDTLDPHATGTADLCERIMASSES